MAKLFTENSPSVPRTGDYDDGSHYSLAGVSTSEWKDKGKAKVGTLDETIGVNILLRYV